jgi:hypothetical protein
VRLLTIDELLAAEDIEAVLVCTRTRDHADIASANAEPDIAEELRNDVIRPPRTRAVRTPRIASGS